MSSEKYPLEIDEIQLTCALRYDGYLYQDKTGIEFPELNKPIIETRRMHEDPLKNFAAFFALQRFLGKWGGEQLTEESPEHIAYDLLYLHLYKIETPVEYAHSEYAERWNKITPSQRENVAQHIRKSLCRRSADEEPRS